MTSKICSSGISGCVGMIHERNGIRFRIKQVVCDSMTTIISQRHKKFYISIILGALCYLALGSALMFHFIKSSNKGDLKPIDNLIPIFSLVVYFAAFYTVFRYYRNAPRI